MFYFGLIHWCPTPSLRATATVGSVVLPLWCSRIFIFSGMLWVVNWGLRFTERGALCMYSYESKTGMSWIKCWWILYNWWSAGEARQVRRSSFIPNLVHCYETCHTFIESQLCHWASSGYTLLCIHFHLCSFALYSAVYLCRVWDSGALILVRTAWFGGSKKRLTLLFYTLVGNVSCIF